MRHVSTKISIVYLVFWGACSHATSFITWHSTNIQLLSGTQYKIGDNFRTIVTLEHANKWRYGDFFTFVDFSQFSDGNENIYAEFTPRLSLSQLTGKSLAIGNISDVFLSSNFEKGENGIARYLMGIGANFSVPGFSFFKVNLWNRNNPDRQDTTWQVNVAWNYPLKMKSADILIEGFVDLIGEEGAGTVPSQLIVPRFLVDIGPMFSMPKKQLLVGIEWQYWHNKFGIEGVTE